MANNNSLDSITEKENLENFEDESDEHKSYKLYNFRRPDKFSKDNLRALRDIHREFSKAISLILSGYLRMRVEIEIVSVDQLTYEEFVRSMPSPISVGVFEFEPLSGQILLGISFEVISCIVNRMLGGVGSIDPQSRELTDIEKALAKKVINIIIKSLEDSWNTIVPVTGKFISLDDNYQSIQVATAGEIVALLTFEVQISGKHFGLFSICFPYPVLETVLTHLSTPHIFQTKGLVATNDERMKMISKLIDQIKKKDAPIVVGLDPQLKFIPKSILDKNYQEYGNTLDAVAESFYEFNVAIMDAVADLIPAV